MGKASRGVAQHKCMRDAVNSTYLPVVLARDPKPTPPSTQFCAVPRVETAMAANVSVFHLN